VKSAHCTYQYRSPRLGAFLIVFLATVEGATAQDAPNVRFEAATAETSASYAAGALGPEHVVSVWQPDDADGPALDVFTRSGVLLQRVPLRNLFEDTSAFAPSVHYDVHRQRFVLAAFGYRQSTPGVGTVPVAVSRSNNPLDGWHPLVITHGGQITGVKLGFNPHWYAVSVYDVNAPLEPGRAHLYVIESGAAAVGTLKVTTFDLTRELGVLEYFDPFPMPCSTYDGSDRLYIVGTHANDTGPGGGGLLRMARIEGPANAPVFVTAPLFPQSPAWIRATAPYPNAVPPAVQPNIPTAAPLVGGNQPTWNDSVTSAILRNGYLWCAHMVGVGSGEALRPTVQWWQISPMTGTTIRSGRLTDPQAPSAAWYAPALAVNTANEMIFAVNRSSATEAISSYYVFIDDTETVIRRLNAGSGRIMGPLGAIWPPSSGAAVDPLDGRSLWAYARHVNAENTLAYWWAKVNPVPVDLGFRSDAAFAAEGTSTFADIVLSDTLLEAVAVNFITNDGTAVYGEDYVVRVDGVEQSLGTLVLSAGTTRASLEIVAIQDDIQEAPTETASIGLILSSKGLIGSVSTLHITIGDSDERPVLLIEETALNVAEAGAGSVDIRVSMDANLGKPFPVSIDYALTGGSAILGEDFVIEVDGIEDPDGTGTLTFDPDDPHDAGDTFDVTRIISVRAINDPLFELAESLEITLSDPVNALPPADPERWKAVVTILDNDLAARPSAGFQEASGVTTEAPGASGAATVKLSAASGVPVEVDYQFEAVTAAVPDFVATGGTTGTLLFEPGQTTKTIPFGITDDILVEGPEYFRIRLTAFRNARPASTPVYAHTINDNDGSGIYLWLDSGIPSEFSETVESVILVYRVSTDDHDGFLVSVSGTGTAQGGLVDYGLSGSSFFVPPGGTSATITLQIINDTEVEADEVVNLVLLPQDEVVTWLPRTAPFDRFLVLDEDEQRQIEFSLTSQSVDEGDGVAEVMIELSEPTGQPVTVGVAVMESTAAAGADYRVFEQNVTIPAGATQAAYQLDLVDDGLAEADEFVALSLISPTANVFIGDQGAHVLTINDDDTEPGPLVNFAQSASVVEESDSAVDIEIPVVLARTVDAEVRVTMALRGGEAVRNDDFTVDLDSVVFSPNTTQASLSLTILGDLIAEGDEQLVLRITSVENGTRGPSSDHVLTIVDDEGVPAVQFAAVGSPATESVGTALVPVVLTAPARIAVSVDYSVLAGTAGGSDFTPATGTADFAPGDTLAFVPVSIFDDSEVEGSETILLTLDAATGIALGFPREHILTVQDDDLPPAVFLGAPGAGATQTVSESSGEVLVLLGLTRPATVQGSVAYTISGTATPGEDFLLDEGTVTFAQGATTALLTLEIIDDDLVEDAESVAITLVNPINLRLDAAATLTFTIADDDGLGIACALPCAQGCDAVSLDSGFEAAVRAALLGVTPDPDTADLDGTGVGDAAHARLLDTVLADPGYENYCCVRAAWNNNLTSANGILDTAFPNLNGAARDQLQVLLAGIFTTQLVPGGLVVGEGAEAFEIDVNDYDTSAWTYLAADGDADLDGVCNAGEYTAIRMAALGIDAFVSAALDPFQNTDGGGCAPCIGEGGACAENGIYTADTLPEGAPDRIITLSELLRVIQFFNSASFGCEPNSEDGYQPNDPDQNCCPHDSDYNGTGADWRIDITELLRLIQIFNTGGYTWCPNSTPPTEDGFCPGLGG
jgi:hypothetical protein